MKLILLIFILGIAAFMIILGIKVLGDEKSYDINCIEDAIKVFDQIDFTKLYECTIIYDYFSGKGTMIMRVGNEHILLNTRSLPMLDRIYYQYRQYTTKNY